MTNTNLQLENEIQEVAKRIRALREDMNLSQEENTKKIGLTPEEYARYESGEEDFSFRIWRALTRWRSRSISPNGRPGSMKMRK